MDNVQPSASLNLYTHSSFSPSQMRTPLPLPVTLVSKSPNAVGTSSSTYSNPGAKQPNLKHNHSGHSYTQHPFIASVNFVSGISMESTTEICMELSISGDDEEGKRKVCKDKSHYFRVISTLFSSLYLTHLRPGSRTHLAPAH